MKRLGLLVAFSVLFGAPVMANASGVTTTPLACQGISQGDPNVYSTELEDCRDTPDGIDITIHSSPGIPEPVVWPAFFVPDQNLYVVLDHIGPEGTTTYVQLPSTDIGGKPMGRYAGITFAIYNGAPPDPISVFRLS
jgi:hypothetical protein